MFFKKDFECKGKDFFLIFFWLVVGCRIRVGYKKIGFCLVLSRRICMVFLVLDWRIGLYLRCILNCRIFFFLKFFCRDIVFSLLLFFKGSVGDGGF